MNQAIMTVIVLITGSILFDNVELSVNPRETNQKPTDECSLHQQFKITGFNSVIGSMLVDRKMPTKQCQHESEGMPIYT